MTVGMKKMHYERIVQIMGAAMAFVLLAAVTSAEEPENLAPRAKVTSAERIS